MARDETLKEVKAGKAACKALSDELDAAKAALAEAVRAVNEAALPVMSEEAERVATYLDAARREVWHLESQLRGLGELWLLRDTPTAHSGRTTVGLSTVCRKQRSRLALDVPFFA
jgi:hypothetical protein